MELNINEIKNIKEKTAIVMNRLYASNLQESFFVFEDLQFWVYYGNITINFEIFDAKNQKHIVDVEYADGIINSHNGYELVHEEFNQLMLLKKLGDF